MQQVAVEKKLSSGEVQGLNHSILNLIERTFTSTRAGRGREQRGALRQIRRSPVRQRKIENRGIAQIYFGLMAIRGKSRERPGWSLRGRPKAAVHQKPERGERGSFSTNLGLPEHLKTGSTERSQKRGRPLYSEGRGPETEPRRVIQKESAIDAVTGAGRAGGRRTSPKRWVKRPAGSGLQKRATGGGSTKTDGCTRKTWNEREFPSETETCKGPPA